MYDAMNQQRLSRQAGFTLAEVLIALGLFALGFVAVAAIFPVGIHLQRQTTANVQAGHASKGAEAVIRVSGVTNQQMYSHVNGSEGTSNQNDAEKGRVVALDGDDDKEGFLLGENGSDYVIWPIENRRHPSGNSTLADPNVPEYMRGADIYWVPLAQNTHAGGNPGSWQLFVCVLHRQNNATYTRPSDFPDYAPHVPAWGADLIASVPYMRRASISLEKADNGNGNGTFTLDNLVAEEELSPGDSVIDSNGVIYKVLRLADDNDDGEKTVVVQSTIPTNPEDPRYIWYGPPADNGRTSPLKRVIVMSLGD